MTRSPGASPGAGTSAADGGAWPVHLVPLGRTGWSLWRECALRSTGFPAAGLLAVCDAELARAVDETAAGADEADGGMRAAYTGAVARLSAAVARIAADPAFRAAVAWQNPALIGSCLDKLVRGEPRNVRGRLHESTVIRYLQRYLLKNDTIGFFGPVGWATLAPERAGLEATPGEDLLAARTTHFEMWAVDEVARSLARRPELRGWLICRRAPGVTVSGGLLRRPLGPPVRLAEAEVSLLERCDGRRTVREVTSGPPGAGAGATILDRLTRLGAVHIGLDGPVDSWPERALRRKLEVIGEQTARSRALADIDSLIAARDAVHAAGNAEELVERTAELAEVFGDLTAAEATRRPGQAYAGRTLVYSDTRRNVDVVVGRVVLDELAAPLGLLLDSARWLVARAAGEYRELLSRMYQEEADASGSPDVPLGYLIARAAPDLTPSGHRLPPPVRMAVEEFQRRWRRVLSWPAGPPGHSSHLHSVSSAALADAVQREFGGADVPWRSAVHHSPDVLIAAVSPEAVRRGEFLLVLGELHLAVNSLDNRFFVQHHDDPRRLLAAAEADVGCHRIYAAPPKSSPFVSSRVWPPVALLSARYTYWAWSGDACSVEPPGPVLAAGSLVVRRRDGALRVAYGQTGAEYDLLEVIGEILSTAVVNAFRPFGPAPHTPRVTVDRLVIARESWTFAAAEVGWAFIRDEAARYAGARAWRACHGLPERVFAVLPVERKPVGVDFTSLALVNILGKEIRRTAEAGASAFSVSEMLPDLPQMWLPDRAGRRYASEFRLVAVPATGFPRAASGRGTGP